MDERIEGSFVKKINCPYCGELLNYAIHLAGEGETPKPGDLSLCLACGEPLIYNDTLEVESIPPALWNSDELEYFRDFCIRAKDIKVNAPIKEELVITIRRANEN